MSRVRPQPARMALMLSASVAALTLGAPRAFAQDMFHKAGPNPSAAAAAAAANRATQNSAAATATARTIQAFQRASQLRQRMDAAQAAARAAAAAAQSNVPNGLSPGGLQVANGVATDPSLWTGADAPMQAVGSDGRTKVGIDQTQAQAILTWDSFNVGRETDLTFDQHGNTDWVALNRVTDASVDPSKILGTIKADGTVLILNRNGIIFSGTSQVNARNIVAAAANIGNDQFNQFGIYSKLVGGIYTPNFVDAGGAVTVDAGAQITTTTPASVTSGGGYVLLLGTSVTNAGSITTPRGQALLAAGDDFVVRSGLGSDTNTWSTTRGNEARGLIDADSASGDVANTGLITSVQGDVTLTGRTVVQDGVLLSTTSVNQRGTIHLLNSVTDGQGSVTLTSNSLTVVLPELDSTDTALNGQRDALIANSKLQDGRRNVNQVAAFDNLSLLPDRGDQSRVEIVSGGNVLFDSGSTVLAQGGQVAATATRRIQTEAGAILDVSGVRGVALDPASFAVKVNVQGNELRDSPVNRDEPWLKSQDVWIDIRDLVLLPAGTGGYTGDRYYTPGGLLEVGGYLANTPHGIGEWVSVGGTITLQASEVVAKPGSVFNVAGGSLDYAAGGVMSSRLLGADGKLYDISEAPAWMQFYGLGNGLVVNHDRWGEIYTQVYTTPLFSRGTYVNQEDAQTVGRDGGTLRLIAPTTLFDGEIVADTLPGARQVDARPQGATDGYKVSQSAAPLPGGLLVGELLGTTDVNFSSDVRFAQGVARDSAGLALGDALAADRVGTIWLDTTDIAGWNLGSVAVSVSAGTVAVEDPLKLADGGRLDVDAAVVDIAGTVTAHGGTVTLDAGLAADVSDGRVTLRSGAGIDVTGLWTDALRNPDAAGGLAFVNGGRVALASFDDLTLEQGSFIDASSGGGLRPDGSFVGGRGGDVSLLASQHGITTGVPGTLTLDGEVRSFGVNGGGTLTLQSGNPIVIGGSSNLAGILPAGEGTPAGAVLSAEVEIPAGEAIPIDFALAEPLEVSAGTPLPAAYTYFQGPSYPAGQPTPANYTPYAGTGAKDYITLQADWTVPPGASGIYTFSAPYSNHLWFPGDVIPKGQVIWGGYGTIPAGYVPPANVFPGGLPTGAQTPHTVAAGTVLDYDVALAAGTHMSAGTRLPSNFTMPAGTVMPAGISFGDDVAIGPVLNLGTELFRQGFSNYVIDGIGGLTVADGARIDATVPVYRLRPEALTAAQPLTRETALELWTPPLQTEDPVSARLQQRIGASLTLEAQTSLQQGQADLASGLVTRSTLASVYVGRGSTITVDPGQSVLIQGMGQVTMDGSVTAHGGDVAVLNSRTGTLWGPVDPVGMSVWIGEDARIDVSGIAVTATDRQGRTYGTVLDGGTIRIGGVGGPLDDHGITPSSDAYVVIHAGAVLDASGAAARIDLSAGLNPREPSRIVDLASNGGSISLISESGLRLDGDMRAAAGGEGAAGGDLLVALENPVYAGTIPEVINKKRFLTVSQERGDLLGADVTPNSAAGALIFGQASIGVDQVVEGGFGSLSLLSRDYTLFKGDVTLSMPESLTLRMGHFVPDPTTPDAVVRLAAPYVSFVGTAGSKLDSGEQTSAVGNNFAASGILGAGEFHVAADMIDIGNGVFFGGLPSSAAFGLVDLTSQSDIRFRSFYGPWDLGAQLLSEGDIVLNAAQIYPATGISATVTAGALNLQAFNAEGTLTIGRVGDIPDAPLSAFGHLVLRAADVEQGGVVRAPFGQIDLGYSEDYYTNDDGSNTVRLRFLPGSVTSTSGDGLIVPYGGTADGVGYHYNNIDLQLNPPKLKDGSGLSLSALSVDVQEGATLDLSGGGDLAGAAFVSGRGGSIDVLHYPFITANPTAPGGSGDQVYAILPGYRGDYAPTQAERGAGDPGIGRQITIGEGIDGLPAGTYTLLPSNYAVLPGAFRVELGGHSAIAGAADSLPDGSWETVAGLSTANTDVRDPIGTVAILTPGTAVRNWSHYGETSYADFVRAQAAQFNQPASRIPADAQSLLLAFGNERVDAPALIMEGTVDFAPATGGRAGNMTITGGFLGNFYNEPTTDIEILADGAQATPGYLSLYASDLDRFGAGTIAIGGYETNSAQVPTLHSLVVRDGATLTAGTIILTGGKGGLKLESGSTLSTIGMGPSGYDFTDIGELISTAGQGGIAIDTPMVVLSNGLSRFAATNTPGVVTVEAGATLLAGGTIGFVAPTALDLDPDAVLGARNLDLVMNTLNVGDQSALAAADAAGVLRAGWSLDQAKLDRLTSGDPALGAPALESLTLTVADSVNLFGSIDLSTNDPATGRSRLALVLNTPALYGAGGADDAISITADSFVWNGVVSPGGANGSTWIAGLPGEVVPGGQGSGSGTLTINARDIVFGYPEGAYSQDEVSLPRLALGFSTVNLVASEQITANNAGTLGVYHTGNSAISYAGGDLNLVTPLITSAAGGSMAYSAGGTVHLRAPDGVASADTAKVNALGGTLSFTGDTIVVDTAIALPSGKLILTAANDLLLDTHATIDLSGRSLTFFDVTKYSWGGDLELESDAGAIAQAAGSTIDVSAGDNDAGTIKATALGAGGMVSFDGTILGSGGGNGFHDGGFDVRATRLPDFAGLNAKLNDAGFFDARSFVIKTGDLAIGDEVRAHDVTVSIDGGSLIVNGTIDASGATPGSIRLAARDGLTLASTAVLDAHGTALQTDSYGAPVEALNRGHVELAVSEGTLSLNGGATIDLSTPGGIAYGDIQLDAWRTDETGGDVRIAAADPLTIRGAATIALNGFWSYSPGDANGTIVQDNGGIDPVGADGKLGLAQVDTRNRAFVDAALANTDLRGRIAGLAAYEDAFHLRPGVEIVSAAENGRLTTEGDLDFAGFRYASVNPNTQQTGAYGSGEPGALVVRASGDLDIYGSVSDGFGQAPSAGLSVSEFLTTITRSVETHVVFESDTPLESSITFTSVPTPNNATGARTSGPYFYFGPGFCGTYCGPATVVSGQVVDHVFGHTFHPGQQIGYFTTSGAGTTFAPGTVIAVTGQAAGTQLFTVDANQVLSVVSGPAAPGAAPGTSTTIENTPDGPITVMTTTGITEATRNLPIPAMAPMLAPGSDSWSMRFVAGADLASADTRTLRARTDLARTGTPAYVSPIVTTYQDVHNAIRFDEVVTYISLPEPAEGSGEIREDQAYYFAGYADGDQDRMPVILSGSIDDPRQGLLGPGTHVGYISRFATFARGTVLAFPDSTVSFDGKPAANVSLPITTGGDPVAEVPALGSITLSDPHLVGSTKLPLVSVVRTGTGGLEMLAGTDYRQNSLFGVYTAGTQSRDVEAAFNLPRDIAPGLYSTPDGTVLGASYADLEAVTLANYRAWYPEHGGDFLLVAQGDASGRAMNTGTGGGAYDQIGYQSNAIGGWLWRQGGTELGEQAAWWINFGTFARTIAGPGNSFDQPLFYGFSGMGTLGGGNATLRIGGDAGAITSDSITTPDTGSSSSFVGTESTALSVSVGGTGRVLADGTLIQTGGGNLDIRIGGRLNPLYPEVPVYNGSYGELVDLRGDVTLDAQSIGRISPYSQNRARANDPRPLDPDALATVSGYGGPIIGIGDGTVDLKARGDLVLSAIVDPGRVPSSNSLDVTAPDYVLAAGTRAPQDLVLVDPYIFKAGTVLPVTVTVHRDYDAVDLSPNTPLPRGMTVPGADPADYPMLDADWTVPAGVTGIYTYGPGDLNNRQWHAGETIPAGAVLWGGYGNLPAGTRVPAHLALPAFSGDVTYYSGSAYSEDVPLTTLGIFASLPDDVRVKGAHGSVVSWFTLWKDRSAVSIFSAGADVIPETAGSAANLSSFGDDRTYLSTQANNWLYYPSRLEVVAGGSIYSVDAMPRSLGYSMTLALVPSANMQLELLAQDSIDGNAALDTSNSGFSIATSLGSPDDFATPFHPGWTLFRQDNGQSAGTNYWYGSGSGGNPYALFISGPDQPLATFDAGGSALAHIYAVNGDITGIFNVSPIETPSLVDAVAPREVGLMPVTIRAGRDIVGLQALFIHHDPTDITTIQAGRDIFFTTDQIAGPGELDIIAGRNLYQGSTANLESLGPIVGVSNGNLNGGAGITLMAGVGATGPDYAAFAARYLDPVNLADPERPLDDAQNDGKVVKTYDAEMVDWLRGRYGYAGSAQDALAYFLGLSPSQQGVFVREVYFDELREGGREYNDPNGKRFQSYIRGRDAIATLFPDKDAEGDARTYAGDITMFSGLIHNGPFTAQSDAGIRTDFGGAIQFLAPGGAVTLGTEGVVPGAKAGVLTQGSGDIDVYSTGSILLGLGRVFTTFGGEIVMWSAEGDINAGRGAKGTVVYAPARRNYDLLGDVALSPTVPTSGAGIGTLAPIPEVPAGDVDLIAPLGTIDAGEAGIRVSGDINLAALHILNAANIQVKGNASGIPQVAAVNTGALTAASATTGAIANEAAQLAERARPRPMPINAPNIIYARFVGFGE